MSRGLGVFQRRVLEVLASAPPCTSWPSHHIAATPYVAGAPLLTLEELKAALFGRVRVVKRTRLTGERLGALAISRTEAANLNRALEKLAARGRVHLGSYQAGIVEGSRRVRFVQLLSEQSMAVQPASTSLLTYDAPVTDDEVAA